MIDTNKNNFNINDEILFNECGFWRNGIITGFTKNIMNRTLICIKDEFGCELVFYPHEVKHRI